MNNKNKEFDEMKFEKLNQYKTSFGSIIYNSRPNLRFKENIVNNFKFVYWNFDNYDIYYKYENKFELFLVYGCNININIVRIEDKKLFKSLKGHKDIVINVKHFYNKNDNNNYLLATDYSKKVYIWDLNKYIQIYKFDTGYSTDILCFIILFYKNYIITATEGTNYNDYTKIYSFIDKTLIMKIIQTSKYETVYLLIWEYKNKYYLIELCYKNIFIYDLSNGKLYKELVKNKNSYFYSGFISYDNKYLYTCTNEGDIIIFNLYDSTLVYNINIKDLQFLKITLWSSVIKKKKGTDKRKKEEKIINYILLSNKTHDGFICIDISFDRELKEDCKQYDTNFKYYINCFYGKGTTIKCIKKIIHPIYGESLLSSGNDKNIDLWINNNQF